jgi:hypothetical protein
MPLLCQTGAVAKSHVLPEDFYKHRAMCRSILMGYLLTESHSTSDVPTLTET